jgi:8-oxo-dGTP pyrophosphatase MutT (NUDIX family)
MKASAIVIIFSADHSSVLLIKRRDVPVWVLPGGGIESGETAPAAAIREAFEETGFQVHIERAVAEYEPINRLASKTYTYACHTIGGAPSTGDETRAVQFFPIDQLPRSFFFIHREWLNDALLGETELICRPLSQVTYWNLALYFCKHPVHVVRMLLSRLGIPINTS